MKRIIKNMIISSLLSLSVASAAHSSMAVIDLNKTNMEINNLSQSEEELLKQEQTEDVSKCLENIKTEKEKLAKLGVIQSQNFSKRLMNTVFLGFGTIATAAHLTNKNNKDNNSENEENESSLLNLLN